MTNKELLECIAAEEAGKKIECRVIGPKYGWARKEHSGWNTGTYEYRIAPEPEQKKEGRWERVEIDEDGGEYRLVHPVTYVYVIDALPRIPGFGGIDYQSPFDPKVIVRSIVPVMFKSEGKHYVTAGDYCDDEVMLFDQTDRPGIPVAAWFWREEK